MHKHIYDLERFGPQPWEDMDDSGETPIPPEASALEEADHAINVAITCWIEALCQHRLVKIGFSRQATSMRQFIRTSRNMGDAVRNGSFCSTRPCCSMKSMSRPQPNLACG